MDIRTGARRRSDDPTFLNTVADNVHPVIKTAFPDGSDLFQQDNRPDTRKNRSQSDRVSVLCAEQVQSTEAPPHNLQDFKHLALTVRSLHRAVIMLWLLGVRFKVKLFVYSLQTF